MSNLQSLLASIESRFEKGFWLHRVPRNTKQMADIKSFIKQSHEEIIQAVVEGADSLKKPLKHDECINGNHEPCEVCVALDTYNRALNDAKALLSPKDT